MNTKNQLPIKWMLVILVGLMAVTYGTYQTSRNLVLGTASSSSSPQNGFFQFLLSLMGIRSSNSPSSAASRENNLPDQNNPNSRQTGGFNTSNQQDLNPTSTNNGSALQGGSNAAQEKNNAAMNAELNAENNAEMNSKDGSEITAASNGEGNVEYNAAFNAENNNAENNSEFYAVNNPALNAENNSENNAEKNAEVNSSNNSGNTPPENNPGNAPGNNSGSNPDQGSGNPNPGDNSGSNPTNSPGNNPWNTNQYSLPTINTIPSDDDVAQSNAKQNQQNDALAALLATRQALVTPVEQQAQSSKYQVVTSPTIPTPSTNQPPADVQAKIQAKQLTYH